MLKIILKIGLVTALVIVAYEIANQLLVYKYLRLDYYLSATALIALVTGILIARRSTKNKTKLSDNPCSTLTNKELQILSLINDGKSNKEIAALNFVELSTIKTHINNLYAKLGVSDRKGAVQIYHQYVKSTFSPPQIV